MDARVGGWKDDFCLLTVHRSENVDSKDSLGRLMRLVSRLRRRIVYPVHPRTRRRLIAYGYWKLLKKQEHIILLPAVGYWDFLWLLSNCRFVMTDSGGVQEEAFTLGVPCITLRENTERPETVIYGRNFVTGMNLTRVNVALRKVEHLSKSQLKENALGDGHAGQRIAHLLAKNNLKSGIEHARFLSDGYAVRCLVPVSELKQYKKVRRLITLWYDGSGRISFPVKSDNVQGWSVELCGEPSVLRPYVKGAKSGMQQ
jgi:UDP-N-acetylglucosamine 2-epimerase